MKFNVLTIFPHIFNSYINESIIGKAFARKKITINVVDIRHFAYNKHQKIDDEPYGGGAGMLMMIEPIVLALESLPDKGRVVLLSPQGKTFNQQEVVKKYAKWQTITFICGRYEGIDYRIMNYIDEEWSIGDFILTGGELAAMVAIDAITRVLPGVITSQSHQDDSFSNNLLEYPQYTRPSIFRNHQVPQVLLSGNHQLIAKWRQEQSLKITQQKRKDLFKKQSL